MAKVEIIEGNGQKWYLMNVSNAVGPFWGMEEDVMLVKALLEFVMTRWGYPQANMSSPLSGTLDDKTKKNIKVYQKAFNDWAKQSSNPSRLTVDGRVSRARGYASWDKNRPWTIVTLNTVAGIYARNYGHKSAAELVATLYPHLARILKLDEVQPA